LRLCDQKRGPTLLRQNAGQKPFMRRTSTPAPHIGQAGCHFTLGLRSGEREKRRRRAILSAVASACASSEQRSIQRQTVAT
jgi:hypothetical protein